MKQMIRGQEPSRKPHQCTEEVYLDELTKDASQTGKIRSTEFRGTVAGSTGKGSISGQQSNGDLPGGNLFERLLKVEPFRFNFIVCFPFPFSPALLSLGTTIVRGKGKVKTLYLHK